MPGTFKRATKDAARIRLGIDGPSGSGKTWTSLVVAHYFAQQAGGRVAVIDTENESASKYVGEVWNRDGDRFDFDTVALTTFSPQTYVEHIHEAESAGYAALVIDSLSHAWIGKGGVLEQHDRAAETEKNSYAAWRNPSKAHNALVEALVQCRTHLIVTIRSKTEYAQEKDENGRTVVKRVGMAPVQREGLEYEFDVMCSMDVKNQLFVAKTRCPSLNGAVLSLPDERNLAQPLLEWVTSGRSIKDRIAVATREYQAVFDEAVRAGITTAKSLNEDMSAPEIERWTVLLRKRIEDLNDVRAAPVA